MNSEQSVFQDCCSRIVEKIKSNTPKKINDLIVFIETARGKNRKLLSHAAVLELIARSIKDLPLDQDYVILQEYPLNEPFAYATIVRNKIRGNILYLVNEPVLSEEEESYLQRLKDLLLEVLDIGVEELDSQKEAKKYLEQKCRLLLKQHFKVGAVTEEKLLYYVVRDNYGFGKIDPLMRPVVGGYFM